MQSAMPQCGDRERFTNRAPASFFRRWRVAIELHRAIPDHRTDRFAPGRRAVTRHRSKIAYREYRDGLQSVTRDTGVKRCVRLGAGSCHRHNAVTFIANDDLPEPRGETVCSGRGRPERSVRTVGLPARWTRAISIGRRRARLDGRCTPRAAHDDQRHQPESSHRGVVWQMTGTRERAMQPR